MKKTESVGRHWIINCRLFLYGQREWLLRAINFFELALPQLQRCDEFANEIGDPPILQAAVSFGGKLHTLSHSSYS
jgi:hypothetical protein